MSMWWGGGTLLVGVLLVAAGFVLGAATPGTEGANISAGVLVMFGGLLIVPASILLLVAVLMGSPTSRRVD